MTLKRKLGARFVTAAAVCATAIAALVVYKPAPETIKKQTCLEAPTIHAVKGDGKCEVAKGEADPLSKNFDPDSCGYCGDDVKQIKSDTGGPASLDLDKQIFLQDVTERPSETKETCPADFHCGNGFLDRGQKYAGVVFEDGNYKISTIKRVESCNPNALNFCPLDCRLRTVKEEPEEEEDEEEPVMPRSYVLTCPTQIAAKTRFDLVSAGSIGGGQVIGRITTAFVNGAPAIRQALGKGPKDDVVSVVSMSVSPSGNIKLTSLEFLCDKKPCENSGKAASAVPLTLTWKTLLMDSSIQSPLTFNFLFNIYFS